MKNGTIALLSILLMGVFAQQSTAQEVQADGAQIEFEKEVHDFGEVAYGGNGYCTFEFTNTGSAPLIISNAKKTCGCTVPEWPKEPIAPGATAKIKVKYDTKRPGAFTKNITISSNAVDEPEKVIQIKGMILAKPEVGTAVNKAGPASK